MILSLLKIGLLSIFACNIPSSLLADSSINNGLTTDIDNIDSKRYISAPYDYGRSDIYNLCYRKLPNDRMREFQRDDCFSFVEEFTSYSNSWNLYKRDIYTGMRISYAGTTYECEFCDSNGSWQYAFIYNINSHEMTTYSIYDYCDVIILSNEPVFTLGNKNSLSFIFDLNNAYIHLDPNGSYGSIIGSTNYLSKYTTENTYNYSNGSYTISFDSAIGGYTVLHGLFYLPSRDEFYTEIGMYLWFVSQGSEVQTDTGIATLPYDCIMVGALFFANNLSEGYESFINDYRYICINDYALYSNSQVPVNHMTMYESEFICIGQYMNDVAHYNNLISNYDMFQFFKDLNVRNFNNAVVVNTDSDINKPTNLLGGTLELMAMGISKLFGFLDIEVFPGITLGVFVFVPFSITILIFILKLFKR